MNKGRSWGLAILLFCIFIHYSIPQQKNELLCVSAHTISLEVGASLSEIESGWDTPYNEDKL